MNLPKKTEKTVVRHEWTIGEESAPTTARDLRDGIFSAQADMEALGVDLSFDDAYHVRAGDGGEIVLYVEKVTRG